jgi:hypothetical protein
VKALLLPGTVSTEEEVLPLLYVKKIFPRTNMVSEVRGRKDVYLDVFVEK